MTYLTPAVWAIAITGGVVVVTIFAWALVGRLIPPRWIVWVSSLCAIALVVEMVWSVFADGFTAQIFVGLFALVLCFVTRGHALGADMEERDLSARPKRPVKAR